MPLYSYICTKCKYKFEKISTMINYKNILRCPKCRCKSTRDICKDIPSILTSIVDGDSNIKLGHLAKRNTDRMSNDEKNYLNYKHNEYKYKTPEHELPSGMTRTKK